MSWIAKNSKKLLTWSGHLSLMPTDDTFDFFLVLSWEQFVADILVVLANIDVDDVVSTHHFILAFLDHWNVASWVDGKILGSLVLLLENVNLIKLNLDTSVEATAHDGSGLIVKNAAMERQWLVLLLLYLLRSTATHF